MEGNGRGLIEETIPAFARKNLKSTRNLSHDKQSRGRDLTHVPPKYGTRVRRRIYTDLLKPTLLMEQRPAVHIHGPQTCVVTHCNETHARLCKHSTSRRLAQ